MEQRQRPIRGFGLGCDSFGIKGPARSSASDLDTLVLGGCAFIPEPWRLQPLEGDMHSLRLLLPLVSALLIAAPGLAQPSQPTVPSSQTGAGEWITQLQPN
jgi:hypothetical protein